MAIAQLARAPEVEASIVSMTPKLAAAYLGANSHNRHIRPTVVARYARDMASGNWSLNGETIKIAASGRVLDGQHRLQSVIDANVPVLMFVVTGLPDDAQDTVDRGLPRNIADALRLHGETNVNVLAGAVAQTIVIKSPTPSNNADAWPSTREALQYLLDHPSIRESVVFGDRLRKAITFPASTGAALHHVFSELDSEDADEFFRLLELGADLASDSPVLRLREMMVREMSAPRRMPRHRLYAVVIKSWNAWRRGDPMLLLKWKTGGSHPEAFPRPE